MMRRQQHNEYLRQVAAGNHPTAAWVTIPWPGVPEVLGAHGVTAAFIDLQHVSHSLSDVAPLILAAEVAGVTPFVRPTGIDREEVTRILDAGAHGIVFPEVETAEQAQEAVSAMRFPPNGTRGWGGAHTRFAGWTGGMAYRELTQPTDDPHAVHNAAFLRSAETELACILIVESVRGVDNIEEIAAVEGIDGVVFGWGDYSVEVGFDVERTAAAARRTYEVCRAAGVGVATPRGSADSYPGCFTIVGVDSLLLSEGFRRAMA